MYTILYPDLESRLHEYRASAAAVTDVVPRLEECGACVPATLTQIQAPALRAAADPANVARVRRDRPAYAVPDARRTVRLGHTLRAAFHAGARYIAFATGQDT